MKFDMDVTANDTLACFWRWLERRGFNPPGHLKVAMFEGTNEELYFAISVLLNFSSIFRLAVVSIIIAIVNENCFTLTV